MVLRSSRHGEEDLREAIEGLAVARGQVDEHLLLAPEARADADSCILDTMYSAI